MDHLARKFRLDEIKRKIRSLTSEEKTQFFELQTQDELMKVRKSEEYRYLTDKQFTQKFTEELTQNILPKNVEKLKLFTAI